MKNNNRHRHKSFQRASELLESDATGATCTGEGTIWTDQEEQAFQTWAAHSRAQRPLSELLTAIQQSPDPDHPEIKDRALAAYGELEQSLHYLEKLIDAGDL